MAKNYQDIYNSVYVTGNKMDWTNAMIRGNGIPLDIYSVFDTYNKAVEFAATNAVAYEGQVLAVTENGDTTVYVITPAKQGTVTIGESTVDVYLKEVGKATLGDNKTIVLNDGVLSLKDFGVKYYAYNKETKAWNTEVTEGWVEGLQPKVVNTGTTDAPVYEIAWFEPSATTVEGLSETIGTLTEKVTTAENTIKTQGESISGNAEAIGTLEEDLSDLTERVTTAENTIKTQGESISGNAEAIEGLEENKADKATTLAGYGITDAYTKDEVNGLVSGAFHFRGEVNYYTELTAKTDVVEGDVYIVKYVGTEGEIPLNAEYAYNGTTWVEFGSTIDLSGYATKTEVAEVSEAVDAINNENTGILKQAKDYTDAREVEINKNVTANTNAINDINNETTGILKQSKDYTDAREVEINKNVTANTNAINDINNEATGILKKAKDYTDEREVEIKKDIKANADNIDAINNENTGILKQAKDYTDTREVEINKNITDNATEIENLKTADTNNLNTAKKYTDDLNSAMDARVIANTNAIDAINNSESGILKTAKDYTDSQVGSAKTELTGSIATSKTEAVSEAKNYTDAREVEIKKDIKSNADAISAINNTETGILKQSKDYADSQVNSAKTELTDAIDSARSEAITESYAYTDEKIVTVNSELETQVSDLVQADATNLQTAKQYTDEQVATVAATAANAMKYKGTVGEGGTVATLPTSNVNNGDTYKVLVDGTYDGKQAFSGDVFIAVVTTTDTSATITWTLIPAGDDGNVNTADTVLTDSALVIGKGNKEVTTLANGTEGQVLTIVNGKPTYVNVKTYNVEAIDNSAVVTSSVEGDITTFKVGVNEVSTDKLIQGTKVLILNGGSSAISAITE